jgi:xanthine/uracil/vitamin C permease (AzgA family)
MIDRMFQLKARKTDVRTEVIAGATTFLTAADIIFVNPSILAASGMPEAALITVTCLVAGLATLLMAFWAKVPLMMAPGMGLNAFFAFTLVNTMQVPWQTALGVVFLSGVFFLLLTLIGFRERIVKAIPLNLRLAASVGIDLFDSLGTMLAVCRKAGLVDEKGEIKELPAMLKGGAVATVAGAMLGTSTTTAYNRIRLRSGRRWTHWPGIGGDRGTIPAGHVFYTHHRRHTQLCHSAGPYCRGDIHDAGHRGHRLQSL